MPTGQYAVADAKPIGAFSQADAKPVDTPLPPSQFPRDAQGRLAVGGSEDNPSDLMTALGHLAHPKTLEDFASLLMVPVDDIRRAAAGALALTAAKGTATAAKPVVSAALSATGRGVETVGKAIEKPLTVGGAVEMFHDPVKGAIALAAPKVLQGAGRFLQRGGAALADTTPAVASDAAAVAPEASAVATSTAQPAALGSVLPSGAPMRGELPKELIEARGLGTTPAVLNDLAIQARRAGIKLTQPEYQAAADLITKQDVTPQQAVSALARMRSGLSPGKLMLSAEETPVWQKLVKDGSTPSEATDAVLGLRKLKTSLGTPSTAEVTASVADRNATGRWNK